ncbi:MAG: saccharopine dehydrogenase NADP-binding domain-containing protein [Deltaproteobacteria bacterium]|nr:saccharopine dehydrogenase NADP-binding domain-containing protein [Deltaproteobacteria bacterium]
MRKKIIVLGAGMVGAAIAVDLSEKYSVASADINAENLQKIEKHNINTICADLTNLKTIAEIISDFDLVIGALPGTIGFKTMETVIKAKKDIADISFFNEDPFLLDELAKKNNVTAITDCGVAPGMPNIFLGHHNRLMNVESFKFYVGGLPIARTMPYQYKAPFSPIDVIAEYTREVTMVEKGKIVKKEALSEIETIEFEPIGTLEAFNTDGLRSLIKTMSHIPEMSEKTLRYPGHASLMKILCDTGFFNEQPVNVNETPIKPIDLTSKLIFPIWKLKDDEEEFTIMRIIIKGTENGVFKTYIYNLFDKFDKKTKISSMSRTTGYTCAAVANLLLEGLYTKKGISPPEYLGADNKAFEAITSYLKDRDIEYKKTSV